MNRLLALLVLAGCSSASADAPEATTWTVHFSPRGGCTDALVALIRSAKASVRVAAYSFTSQPIADALILAAHTVTGKVELVLDKSDARSVTAERVRASGAEVWIDSSHSIMHDKFIVIDGLIVETGSFNFTKQAEKSNAENCLILRDKALAWAYIDNWQLHRNHAHPMGQ